MSIQNISAITFAVRDMARAVEFYEKLGFAVDYGGRQDPFTSMKAGETFVNLQLVPEHSPCPWGRVIFRVDDVDALYRHLIEVELQAEFAPRDATWGERYFHILDPEGHELSFAQMLT